MTVMQTAKDMFNYRFPEEDGFLYGFNLYALLNGSDVLLFDAAFRTQAKQVVQFLESRSLKLTHLIVTHFHPDHIAGLSVLDPGITVLGSPEYGRTLARDLPQKITPVSFTDGFSFGDFNLKFIPAPGHSACSIFVDINGEYLHAGDTLMARYDGKAILPWVVYHQLENHISSLKKLLEMGRDKVILGHGPEIHGKVAVKEAVDDRLSYLAAVLESKGNCTYNQAVSGCSCSFAGEEFFRELTAGKP
jgi:hydroxyacylglutathione hydrolase